MSHNLTRRDAIKITGLAGLAGLLQPGSAAAASADRKRSLRIAHLTDIHVEPERRAGDGMAAAFRPANELADANRPPTPSCLGNHDCGGWHKKHSKTTGDEPDWGKKRSLDHLKMPGRFYSVDKAGWHLVFLDSIQPDGDGYRGGLDEEQFEWLKGDV